jgi:hypothetical protein
MSLISDALKKARQEAARQDSLRQGLPYAVGAVDTPARRDPWISLLAGLGAGCLLAAAVFALAFFAGWGPFHKPAVESRTAAVPAVSALAAPAPVPPVALAAPAPTLPPAEIPEAERPAAPPAAPPVLKAPAPEARPTPAAPQVAPPANPPAPAPMAPVAPVAPMAETSEPAAPPSSAAPAAPAPPAPSVQPLPTGSATGLEEGKVYAGEVPIPGGGSVKLNGIAFSQDHPVAVLDGRVMGPGESVGGFTIVAIESGRVKLQGHGATVFLSPK